MRPSSLFYRKSMDCSRDARENFESRSHIRGPARACRKTGSRSKIYYNNMHDLKAKALRLGATDLRQSWRAGKKYAVLYQGKWIHFGALGYEDYTIHHDDDRRASYRRRHRAILLRDGRPAYKVPSQAGYWSWQILW